MLLIPLIIIILYAIAEGLGQGIVYHWINKSRSKKYNEHIAYAANRVWIGIGAMVSLMYMGVSTWHAVVATVAAALCHPFFHLGSMYWMRRRLSNGSVYTDGWWSEPRRGGTNRMSISCDIRTGLAIVGFVGYLTCLHLDHIAR